MSDNPISAIILATSTSIGKTFLIGLSGYIATRYPKEPAISLIPPSIVSPLSRVTFTLLILPLIYEGIASSVKLESLELLYPIIVISFCIICISFLVTVTLGYLPCFRIKDDKVCFRALCIASTFPNIVALPITIFPTLCEYDATHDMMDMEDIMDDNTTTIIEYSASDRIELCIQQTNAVIFTYFFGFSLVIWTIGQHALVNLGRLSDSENHERTNRHRSIQQYLKENISYLIKAIKDIFKLPTFQLMIVAFITVCIPPLQKAMFHPGGYMRVLGSALEALSNAGSTVATILVAATLGQRQKQKDYATDANADGTFANDNAIEKEKEPALPEIIHQSNQTIKISNHRDSHNDFDDGERNDVTNEIRNDVESTNNIISRNEHCKTNTSEAQAQEDRLSCPQWIQSLQSIPAEDWKIYLWQISSRLFVTPFIVYLMLIQLDCFGFLEGVPSISKLVLLINSALPGALVVVVILKAEGLTDIAAVVSKTYLPIYSLSMFTVAMWSSIGLMTWRTDSTICERF